MLKTLRHPPTKSLISAFQSECSYSSKSEIRNRIVRARAEQKELYGRIIRGNGKRSTKNKAVDNGIDTNIHDNKSNTEMRVCHPELASEFYWLVQNDIGAKNVKIFKSSDAEVIGDTDTSEPEPSQKKKS